MIVIITIAAVISCGAISYFFLTPMYSAKTQLLVSQQATGASIFTGQFGDDSEYIETYNVIMKSPYILEKVIEDLDLKNSPNVLNQQLSVAQEGKSQVITIRIQDKDPAMAVKIANSTAKIFQGEILNLMKLDNVHILSSAELGKYPTPISPNPKANMAIGFVVGLMVAIGIAFLLEYLNNKIHTEQDIEKHLGIPVLGAIPVIEHTPAAEHGEQMPGKKSKRNKLGSGTIGA